MNLVIRRKDPPGGGEDVVSLADLLREAGYFGEFEFLAIEPYNDAEFLLDGETIFGHDVTVS